MIIAKPSDKGSASNYISNNSHKLLLVSKWLTNKVNPIESSYKIRAANILWFHIEWLTDRLCPRMWKTQLHSSAIIQRINTTHTHFAACLFICAANNLLKFSETMDRMDNNYYIQQKIMKYLMDFLSEYATEGIAMMLVCDWNDCEHRRNNVLYLNWNVSEEYLHRFILNWVFKAILCSGTYFQMQDGR